jgi:hypothetical protein
LPVFEEFFFGCLFEELDVLFFEELVNPNRSVGTDERADLRGDMVEQN